MPTNNEPRKGSDTTQGKPNDPPPKPTAGTEAGDAESDTRAADSHTPKSETASDANSRSSRAARDHKSDQSDQSKPRSKKLSLDTASQESVVPVRNDIYDTPKSDDEAAEADRHLVLAERRMLDYVRSEAENAGIGELLDFVIEKCRSHPFLDNEAAGVPFVNQLADLIEQSELHQKLPRTVKMPDGQSSHAKKPLPVAKMAMGFVVQLLYLIRKAIPKRGDEPVGTVDVLKLLDTLFRHRHDRRSLDIITEAAQEIKEADEEARKRAEGGEAE
ncbi:MAG: hypothetical protein U0804_02675 [Gemmataceae bacterium]